MTENTVLTSRTGPSGRHVPTAFVRVWFVAALTLFLAVLPGRADEQEDEYLRIYQNIQDADSLNAAGKAQAALAKYRQADADLAKFRNNFPSWNRDMVTFRLNYVIEKATGLIEKLNAATPAPAAGGSKAPTTKGPEQALPAPAADQPIVTLLEPGAEPRKPLRLHPKPGDKQTVTLTVETTMERTEGQGQAQTMKAPALLVTVESTVKDVSAEGDISYQNVITEAGAGPEPAGMPPGSGAALNAAYAEVKGLTTLGVLSDRGFSKRKQQASKAGEEKKGRDGKQPPAAARMLKGQLDTSMTMLTTPFPEEPVGAGAKWEVKMGERSMGGSAKVICEVVAIDGERVTAKLNIAISASLGEGTKQPDLGKMKIDGSGDLTIDLTRIMPTQGNLKQRVQMPEIGGADKKITGAMVTDFRIETK